MDQETKDKLKLIPTKTCTVCKTKRSYGNPMTKCYECGKFFCYNHIQASQVKKGMGSGEALRDICGKCVSKHNYSVCGS